MLVKSVTLSSTISSFTSDGSAFLTISLACGKKIKYLYSKNVHENHYSVIIVRDNYIIRDVMEKRRMYRWQASDENYYDLT